MQGHGVSKGLCYAKVLVLDEEALIFPSEIGCPEEETEIFWAARADVLKKTIELRDRASNLAEAAAEILDVHCSLLEDKGLLEPIQSTIDGGAGAAAAVEQVMNGLIRQFEGMENTYFSQRALDIKDIKENLIRRILKIEKEDISCLPEPTIIAGKDITPSTTAAMDTEKVVGMLMEMGGASSHTAILAKTLDIPAIVGIKGLLGEIQTGQYIGFDGATGEVFTHLNETEIADLQARISRQQEENDRRNALAGKKAVTRDGVAQELWGNIGSPADADKVLLRGGTGIGLFRSEFLYLASDILPDEEKQYLAYKQVLEFMGEKPVIVRTLDIGGDKEVARLQGSKEENPFLGVRAIRLCRRETAVFHTQLRALLRASVYGNMKIMFPMISSLEELRWAKEQLDICRKQLDERQIPYIEKLPIGIMVEIPAVAVCAEQFAAECDFFSIGTNDLTQYALAADRGNKEITDLCTWFHPGVIRLIQMTITAAHKKGISCGMCGEAAGDPKMLPLLLGLGLDEYSMAASAIPEIKELMGKLEIGACKKLAEQILQLSTAAEVEQKLDGWFSSQITCF